MANMIVQPFKRSINATGLPSEQVNLIWEFYVTKSFAMTASQKRLVSEYGLKTLPFDDMIRIAGIREYKIIMCNTMKTTLSAMDLEILDDRKLEKEIEIDRPRIACIWPFSISDENPPQQKIGKAECVFTHMRNAFAHGNTYFFDNGFMMLEDKDNSTITARMIIRQQTLLDWVRLIDKDQRFYVFHDGVL
jgi:hypothetical protein